MEPKRTVREETEMGYVSTPKPTLQTFAYLKQAITNAHDVVVGRGTVQLVDVNASQAMLSATDQAKP
jgi:hypothetical protein